MSLSTKPVVVLGGGIHGASIAYYLSSKFERQVTVVERTGVAGAASGKAGGFLARDWGSRATVQIHETSYRLHRELASELSIESYRQISTLQLDGNNEGRKAPGTPKWLDRTCSVAPMDDNTAQVTPFELTSKLMDGAVRSGAQLLLGTADALEFNSDRSRVEAVIVDGKRLECETLVVALGPWSGVFIEDNFDVSMGMEGIKSTSVVLEQVTEVREEPFAVFCAEDSQHCHLELYPRPNGELYICGLGGSDYVSGDRLRRGGDCESADKVLADPRRVDACLVSIRGFSSLSDARQPGVVQACMRPVVPDGLPVMGQISAATSNAFCSTAHNQWGILMAPAAGLAMAELVATGRSQTLDLSHFSPSRFAADNRGSRGKRAGGNRPVGEQW